MRELRLTRLKEVREKRYLTQEVLAQKTGISIATLSRLEHGVQAPRFSTLHKLATALGVKPQELMEDEPMQTLAS